MRGSGEQVDGPTVASDREYVTAAVVIRYLVGRSAVESVNRAFVMGWLAAATGVVLLLLGRTWLGLALLVGTAVAAVARGVLVRAIRRMSLGRAYRQVEDEFADMVEGGRANLRRELDRVGLPSAAWRMPLFALRLARDGGEDLVRRLSQVNLERVLPQVQIERAGRLLDRVRFST